MGPMTHPSPRRLSFFRGGSDDLAVQVESLTARVAELEEAVSECRRHHHRTAELTDVVQELLVPLATGDATEARRIIDAYTSRL